MEYTLKPILLITIFILLSMGNTFAQHLRENQVPLKVQSSIYRFYPGTKMLHWEKKVTESRGNLYQVRFKHGTEKATVVFSESGIRIYEDLEYSEKNSPSHFLNYAVSNFFNCKIIAVHKHTNFVYKANTEKMTNYELVLKIEKEINSVWFDEAMYRHNSFETSTLAIE